MTENTKTEETRKSIFVGETDNKNNANYSNLQRVWISGKISFAARVGGYGYVIWQQRRNRTRL